MKRLIYLTLCLFTLSLTSCNNSRLFEQLGVFQKQLREETYKLYPTENMWTFLELNTATGQIWIVQWSTENEKRFVYTLDDRIRITEEDENICGRFTLYPTENMYNFLLLDTINGGCWQVQWNFDEDKRFVVPIS